MLATAVIAVVLASCGGSPAPTSTSTPEPQTQQGRLVERATGTADLLDSRNQAIEEQLAP